MCVFLRGGWGIENFIGGLGVINAVTFKKFCIMKYAQAIESAPVVLVEFYASWCPHCKRMAPIVEQVKELVEGQASVYQYDIDENSADANEAGVESIPTFILFVNGEETWRYSGEIDGNTLVARVESAAGQAR